MQGLMAFVFIINVFIISVYLSLSCHTGSLGPAYPWRVFEPRLLQKVSRFVARIYTVLFVELGGYCHEGG